MLIAEQTNNLDRLAERIASLSQHEQSLRDRLRQVEQERDQLRSLMKEAMNEIESRDITIDELRSKLRKRKT
jgi:uncharacterized coiled-coil DUF342 family protein